LREAETGVRRLLLEEIVASLVTMIKKSITKKRKEKRENIHPYHRSWSSFLRLFFAHCLFAHSPPLSHCFLYQAAFHYTLYLRASSWSSIFCPCGPLLPGGQAAGNRCPLMRLLGAGQLAASGGQLQDAKTRGAREGQMEAGEFAFGPIVCHLNGVLASR